MFGGSRPRKGQFGMVPVAIIAILANLLRDINRH